MWPSLFVEKMKFGVPEDLLELNLIQSKQPGMTETRIKIKYGTVTLMIYFLAFNTSNTGSKGWIDLVWK